MRKVKILWADDEIELLKPHIMFLEDKGYQVDTAVSGDEALDLIDENYFDIVFLDENMPGLSGLEVLSMIKKKKASLPVVMITKSEEEYIMEEAIGSKIADYLIKPVNPNQILLAVKKNIDEKRLVSQHSTSRYQKEFREIGMTLTDNLDHTDWIDVYKKLTYHELELDQSEDSGMDEVLEMQKTEANSEFGKFIEEHYLDWLGGDQAPIMSHTVLKEKLLPELEGDEPVFFVLMDCLRYDQWKVIQRKISELFKVKEDVFYSILPTATQYCRNALFAGLMPSEIQKLYPEKWVGDDEEDGKNMHEEFFATEFLKRHGKNIKVSYSKVTNLWSGRKLVDKANELFNNDLNIIVYNFVDALSHARTDFKIVRELAEDASAFRDVTASWFEHSPLWEIMKMVAKKGGKIVITTDHGSVHVKDPSKVVGDKNVNTNLRYKQGKTLNYNPKEVFEVIHPEKAYLPRPNVSTRYIFAKNNLFFAYPNNFNYYVKHYKNTFQHGGISLEEMLVPFAVLESK